MKVNKSFILYCAISVALCSVSAYFLSTFYSDHRNEIYSYENIAYTFLIFSMSVVALWFAFKKLD